jgi:hypothetical protein
MRREKKKEKGKDRKDKKGHTSKTPTTNPASLPSKLKESRKFSMTYVQKPIFMHRCTNEISLNHYMKR